MIYSKLYVNGKRDPRRRYIDDKGNIVSRRQAETAIFGESPEQKAVRRVEEGKAKPGITSRKYSLPKVKRPEEKISKRLFVKEMPTGKYPDGRPKPSKNVYQLSGKYEFAKASIIGKKLIEQHAIAVGYSYTHRYRDDASYFAMKEQSILNAKAKLQGSGWEFVQTISEHYIKW